jgi:hypothetical protein
MIDNARRGGAADGEDCEPGPLYPLGGSNEREGSMRNPPLSAILEASCKIMNGLLLCPCTLRADANGAEMLTTTRPSDLRTRSRGPYPPDAAADLPPEAASTVRWISLRWDMTTLHERPEVTAKLGGQWPRVELVAPASRVLVQYVVPEDAPRINLPASESAVDNLTSHTMQALRFVASTLAASRRFPGKEPPMTVTLRYADDPAYEAALARTPPNFRELLSPVLPVVDLDRRQCSRRHRAAHDQAMRSVGYQGHRFDPVRRDGFITSYQGARVQDRGTDGG